MQEKTFIYTLESPGGEIRYVGKTDDIEKRLSSHMRRRNEDVSHKNSWLKSLAKKGQKPIIRELDCVPKDEWKMWESHYIWLLKSWGLNLTNGTYGGDGMSNPKKETLDKISNTLKEGYRTGRIVAWAKGTKGVMKSWNKGVKQSEEFKENMSQIKKEYYKENDVWNKGVKGAQEAWNKGKKGVMPEVWNKGVKGAQEAWNKGKKYGDETIKKIRENSAYNRKILQYTLKGEFVKEYMSAAEARRQLPGNVNVSTAANEITHKAAGYIWIWKDDLSENPNVVSERVFKHDNQNKNKSRCKGGDCTSSKKVVQICMDTGEILNEFNSIVEAKQATGKGNIGRACRTGGKANGTYWKYM